MDSYIIAHIATTCDLALSAADLWARVLGSGAPRGPEGVGHLASIDVAARRDGWGQVRVEGLVLSGGEAGESRSGDEKSGVEHRGRRKV